MSAEVSLAGMIKAHVSNAGECAAIQAPGRPPMSYSDLGRQIEYTESQFNQIGFGPRDRIALVLPNGPEMAAGLLSVASFCVCAPLNPRYSAKDYEFYLSDLSVRGLLIDDQLDSPARDVAARLGIEVLELSAQADMGAGTFEIRAESMHADTELRPNSANDIALLLHTSGTTSRPKIVPLTHRNLCASAQNVSRALSLSSSDTCLNVMPLFHIHGIVGALLSSLAAGQSVVCTPGFDAESFFSSIDEFAPTWYTAVPTIHRAVLAARREWVEQSLSGRFRFIRSSSSALPARLMEDLERTFGCPVIEAYGMTEAAHQICSNPLPPGARKPGSVGLPAGPEVAAMSADGRILPASEIGELVIRGANVTQGYENNRQANQEAYDSGWFRTGDQGFIDPDGFVTINGRLKEIINRGGETISPQMIDEALLQHPSIQEAVAFAVDHPSLGEDIAAVVVLKRGVNLSERAIREFAFEKLADYMVPSQIVIVEEIPKGSTGKVQRIGLGDSLRTELQKQYVAPVHDVEVVIAEIWADILQVDRVGIDQNFFALGGDSLMGTRVITRLRDIFGATLLVSDLFAKPNVSDLAELIRASADPSRLKQVAVALAQMRADEIDSP